MMAYPVQVDEAIWMVPLNLPPPPAVFWAPQADRTNASIVNRGRSDRFANMESPPRADSAPRTNSGLGGAGAGPRALCQLIMAPPWIGVQDFGPAATHQGVRNGWRVAGGRGFGPGWGFDHLAVSR